MRIGVQITKTTLFRGVQQEFHNTYHFQLNTAVTAPSESIVDEIVTKEKAMHSVGVNFKLAKVWTAGGTKAENQMIFQKNLTGTGSATAATSMDKERCILARWPAGFDSKGRPVYLRKYWHIDANIGAGDLTANDVLKNTAKINAAGQTAIKNAADGLSRVGSTEFWQLVGPSGRAASDQSQAHPYLEHHQLGDQWRV